MMGWYRNRMMGCDMQLTETIASTNCRMTWDINRKMDCRMMWGLNRKMGLTLPRRERTNTLKPISQKQNKLGHKRETIDFRWLFK